MTSLPWQGLAHEIAHRIAVRSREWARQRQGSDGRATELHPRRIYILPTRAGLIYGLIVTALLLSSMNFSNNMGFALTFLLAAIGIVSMHHCQRNLSRVRVELVDSIACFAGQEAAFRLRLHNPGPKVRWQLQTGWDRHGKHCADLNGSSASSVTLFLAAPTRGVLPLPRFSVSSTFPLGLFRAWTWIHMEGDALVWPQPAAEAEQPAAHDEESDTNSHQQNMAGEDLAGVRIYQPGDSPRRIDWKGFARHGDLHVREFSDGAMSGLWLDWDALPGASTESKLSLLARLALDAAAEDRPFGLRLPGTTVNPGSGETHLKQCLDALALHGVARNLSC